MKGGQIILIFILAIILNEGQIVRGDSNAECAFSNDCPRNEACVKSRCKSLCTDVSCGRDAECKMLNHNTVCKCKAGYTGDPFKGCISEVEQTSVNQYGDLISCAHETCGINAKCVIKHGQAACVCEQRHTGDPYIGCNFVCHDDEECLPMHACIEDKCQDPCPGACGSNADCFTKDHLANCVCKKGYGGDAHVECFKLEAE